MLHLQSMGIGVTGFRGKSWVKHARKKARNPLTNHYRCADDKWILFSEIQADRFWPEFCRALTLDELIEDPRFATAMGGSRENAFELIDILDRTLATKTRDEWVARFEEMKAPFAYSPVQDYYEVFEDPQVLANDYIVEFDHPTGGRVKVMGYPWRFSETPAQHHPRGAGVRPAHRRGAERGAGAVVRGDRGAARAGGGVTPIVVSATDVVGAQHTSNRIAAGQSMFLHDHGMTYR